MPSLDYRQPNLLLCVAEWRRGVGVARFPCPNVHVILVKGMTWQASWLLLIASELDEVRRASP